MTLVVKEMDSFLDDALHPQFKSKVTAPKNPKLIREPKKVKKLSPSEFLKEISMNTKEKLAATHEMYIPQIIELLDMGETSLQKNTTLPVDEPMFQPFPSEIYFQKYDKFNTYEVPLLLRNNDKVPRLVKVSQIDTPYFKIISSADSHHKVGPGLSITFVIQFTPEENKDYTHEIIVSSEREKYVIPIRCIGARAILDYPDEINFSTNAVKFLNTKVLLVRNIGNKDAKFSLAVEKPFVVNPDHGILPIGENMQVLIEFQPEKCGDYAKELKICYDSNEIIYSKLYGVAQDINVRLEKNSLRIEDTFITMTNQRTVTINNRSDILVHFEWKKYATSEEEDQQKLKTISTLNREEENAKNKISDQSADYMALLSRNFKNKVKHAQSNTYLFEDEVFFISPIEGDIWPNTNTEINIIFKPDFAQLYNRVAFCEITGRESRLPLRLCGLGLGPKVQFSIETLDVGNIFIGSTHVYEVVMSNRGFIDAIYSIGIPNSGFGKCFMFEPSESLISPNGFQAIRITFKSNKLGNFRETFDFTIDGNPEKCPLVISGNVIAPTFNFDVPKIKFGLVSFGFKYSQTCYLYNTSLVPMKFSLRVLSDSEATRSFDGNFNSFDISNFKEFSIIPKSGMISPQSEMKIIVEFIPHFIKKYETSLAVDIEDVGDEFYLLPISARSTVPTISLLTSTLDIGRCFINHTYNRSIKLSNDTSLASRYFIMPSHSDNPFKFQSAQSEGIIDAHSIKEVTINIEALRLGYITGDLYIKINGSVEQPLKCSFTSLCQGPVIHIVEKEIDWGMTPLLQDVAKEVVISNESLIVAKYTTNMTERNSPWRIEPAEGVIEPGSEFVLKAICFLADKKRYADTLVINIEHSFPKDIKLKAQGHGSSIVSEPNIGNTIDFGTFFSNGNVKKVFQLTNKSSRTHNLSFHPEGRNIASINKKEMAKEKELPPLMFKITPHRVDLLPGETKEIQIEGFSDKAQLIEEYYTCQAIIGKSSGKDRIMKFKIRCEFIEPLVSFSKKEIEFRCERDGLELPKSQMGYIIISNISSLSLNSRMNTDYPFTILNEDTNEFTSEIFVKINTGENKQLTINFDPSFKKDFHNETVNGQLSVNYMEHQHTDYVSLKADIYYPNIHLESNLIDFECILNNTESIRYINMTNIGPLPVNYKWSFVIDENTVVERLITNKYMQKSLIYSGDTDAKPIENEEIITEVVKEENNEEAIDENKDNNNIDNPPDTLVSNSESEMAIAMNPNKDLIAKGLNQKLEQLVVQDALAELPSYEEVFDISPIYGSLSPSDTQQLTITFFGHKEIKAFVKAVCQIENGPEYEMILKGEASVLSYEISTHFVDLAHIPYDQTAEASIVVKNTGKVRLQFNEIGLDAVESSEINKPFLTPATGSIDPDSEQVITIKYLPGIPLKFNKKILLQIAHFPPDEIIIQGEASFADIVLDLPRFENEEYKGFVEQIKGSNYKKVERPKIEVETSQLRFLASSPDFHNEAEVDRLAIETFVKQQQQELKEPENIPIDGNISLDEIIESPNKEADFFPETNISRKPSPLQSVSSRKKIRPNLPDYILDFGHVILGTVKTHVIRAVNMGEISASFEIERQNFSKTGFLIDVERVKNLPNQESIEFLVTFDPRGANLPLGSVEHVIPINIINGPIIQLRLKANVTMPDLQISNDVIEFSEVKCGECKIITVQIHNHKEVKCDWSASYLPNKDDKFTPLHLKRKKKTTGDLNKPHVFEIMPPSGTMLPGQKLNIQVKFMPTEEKAYEERVTIRMAQSSQRLMVLCKGRGLEPRIEFSKSLLEFEPILPHSAGDEQEIKIINPCSFPVEIYSLEFDKNYLEEEKVLRTIRGYDEFNTILLPPRNATEKLPIELFEYYEEQLKKTEEEEKKRTEENAAENKNEGDHADANSNPHKNQESPGVSARGPTSQAMSASLDADKNREKLAEKKPLGQENGGDLEKNPVYESIARYLGIDLSVEGRAARNRRGVAIIVHGAPLTGKSKAASVLAKHYDCALLTIDSIITDAIANSKSVAASKARQLCAEAATKSAEDQKILDAVMQQNAAANGGISNSTGLSAEALAQHSLKDGSQAMSKKTSVAGDSHTKSKKKADISDVVPQQPSSPLPLLQPVPRKLSINSFGSDDGYMSVVLAEDIIVDLMNERFQLPDCQRGIIIDGLDTVFMQNHLHAATAILKAFNNRRYIYCFTMKSDFQKYKEQMNKIHEEKMRLKREKEEKERIELEEMDDESYENMPDEKKKEIDIKLLHAKKLRLKREAEEKAAEMERREKEAAEAAKIEEEKKKQKKKPGTTPSAPTDKKSTVPQPTPVVPPKPAAAPPTGKDAKSSLQVPNNQSGDVRPHTRSDNPEDTDKSKRKRVDSISKPATEDETKEKLVDPEEEKRKEAERLIHQKYKTFDLFFKDIMQLFDSWDRTQGTVYRQPSPSEKSDHDDVHVKKTLKKQPEKTKSKDKVEKSDEKAKESEKEKAKEKEKENHQKQEQKDHQQDETVDNNETTQNPNSLAEEKKEDGIGITHIIYDNNNKANIEEIYKNSKLPPLTEVLDGMGLGPRGPPIPPPAAFSVIPFPAQRKAPPCVEFGHYIFVSNIENDPNLISDEKPKEPVVPPEAQVEEDKPPEPSSSKLDKTKKGAAGGRGSRSESKTETAGPRKTSGDKKKEIKGRRESSAQSPINDSKYQSENNDGMNSVDGSAIDKPSQKLQRFRWVIPSQSEIVIRLRFTSEEVGQYDQTLNFEIVGTRRRYQVFCRGICAFPTISREPRIVFTKLKKGKNAGSEIVSHKFITYEDKDEKGENKSYFEFGPLLVGSNRERLKEGKFPEYQETIMIFNSSPMDSEISFCFLEDNVDKAELCFFLEQTDMVLKPNETKSLKIFATPKETRAYEDSLICCIKENPEPVIFKFKCTGQKPELQLDKKEFLFKQVLLHRKDSRDINMTNKTMIPVQWRLEGVDLLGDEFVCNQTNGIIEPNNSFNLLLHFRALKPLNITAKDKKALKLLVSDVNGFLGFMENHTITITAEAYDVALEINLPKGNDGGLEFGTIRVNSENKQICNLKNKGKYNIKYNFIIEPTGPDAEDIRNCLTISPASGELQSIHDRNAQQHQIQVIVNTKKELTVKDLPIIKCQITEPQATSEGSVIANIPIKISFKAVFSKFNIIPQSDINFGVLNVNAKRQEKIIIENKGDFDFKFIIQKYVRESVKLTKTTNPNDKNKQREGSSQTKTTTKRNDSVRDGGGGGAAQGRLQVGIFGITPGFGFILPGGHQAITIDCLPETSGKQEEELLINITDADVSQLTCANGIIYKLAAEATVPNIAISPDIFEEHTIIPNISVLDHKTMGIGIYCEEENRFLFNNVIVARTAKARFKLYNTNKIPIDLVLALRSSNRNVKSVNELVFDIEPSRVQVQPFCFSFATVTFTPQAIMSYTSLFEATLESSSSHSKNKSISFEITGEGNLPRFSVVKPSLRNKKGQHLMLFKRNVVNHMDHQSLVLSNEGTLAAKINFSLNDPDSAFKIKANPMNKDIDANDVVLKDHGETVSSIVLQPGQQISFIVSFMPSLVQNYEGVLQLTVTDNQFEDTLIQFIGEGYMEDVTLDNLHSINNAEYEDEIVADEEVTAIKGNSINFGDIYINESRQLLFTMTNRHKQNCFRFEWPENSYIAFSPRIGHLHANCVKDVSVTFKSPEPKYMKKEIMHCTLTKIAFDVSANEVKDWDDRMTIIKWVNEVVMTQVSTNEVYRPSSATTSINTSLASKPLTIKKKVIDTEPEPHYTKIDDNLQQLELVVAAKCDYSRYKCSNHVAKFKDTLLFQTRVYEVSIINRGKIQFDYNWKVAMEDRRRPFTPLIQEDIPTPETSPSPRGRSKNKGQTETSVSPPRKPIKDAKDAKDSKKDNKDAKGATGKKAPEKAAEKTDEKSVKGGKKGKEKDSKDADDARKETATNPDMVDAFKDDHLRAESQAQMRAESALSFQAPSIMSESGYVPFSVEPAFGKLEPGKTQLFKIKFAPLDVNDYQARITCLIPNLEDGKAGPVVAVKGRGSLPYCHFDIEESDYITAGRRDPERPGPNGDISGVGLDSMTKVIEFKSVGLFTKCVKKFDIINPTNTDYEYEFIREDLNDIQKSEMFSCINEKGVLKSGRRQEIIFEFTPQDFGTHESFWKFKSPKYNVQVSFLLVGDVSKPKVVFDRSHVLFKPLLIGMLGHETVNIINQENKPFEFKFDTNSCYTEGRSEVVIIEPCNGTVPPLSRIPIKISLKPREQRQLIFNLKCMLSNSSKPLLLNVKGEGFAMQTSLFCEDNNGNKVEFGEGNINEIHFGEVEKNETAFRNLYVLNVGKFKIDFDCYLTSEMGDSLSCFSIEPQKVSIDPGQKHLCVLKYHAKKEKPSISNLVIKVDHGAVYHIHVDGIAVKPDIQFSFNEYNFGPCFIYKAGMPVQSVKLNILNAGSKEINVDWVSNNASLNSCFLIDFKQTILMPKESTTMSISFIPRESLKYEEKVIFELNGLTRREINLQGVGTEMRIELVDNKQKVLGIGTLEIGKSTKKTVKIVNKSVAFIEFNLLFEPKNEILLHDKDILQIQPFQGIKLKPNQILDLQVSFKPKSRIEKFYEEVKLEYNGICTPLFAINGACHGYNIWIDSNTLPFGAVVQKCSTTKRFVMHNSGDIGACFKWETEKLKPEFSISPINGYISPGMDINFDVTFSPNELSQDIRKDNIKCILEGCAPIAITFTGSCIQSIPQKEVQQFETFTRQKETRQINIQNKTNSVWEIKPIIEGEYFSGLETLMIEPQSTKAYDIVYAPLSMTLDGKKHTGTCFFPLPDGTGLSYNLIGTSGSPKPSGRVTRDVPCKLQTSEILILENWLKKAQRFKVIYEFIKPDKPDPSTTIKGHDYVDVPGNGKKEYKLNYFAHKEGVTQVKVIFKNEQTAEYLFYELSFKAIKGGSIGTIDLVTPVRVSTQYSLKMENPLPNAANFTLTCTNNTEVLIPTNVQIVAKGQGDINIEYLPLKVGEMTAKLELTSGDLGVCSYDLNLKALPTQNERALQFKTTIGTSQTITAKFTNFCKQRTDYICKIDNPDFRADKSITAAPSQTPSGIEVTFDITFEPSNLGEIKSILVLSSPLGGDYVFPLFGSSQVPKPQGPYIIKANGNTSISFKNVFASQLQYTFAIDNPLFYVTKATDTIKPHQSYKIIVGFDGSDTTNKADVMGKLIVSPPKIAGLSTNVQWIYYLKGVTA